MFLIGSRLYLSKGRTGIFCNKTMLAYGLAMDIELSSLTGDEGSFQPLGKLDYLYSKFKCFQLKNGKFLIGS